jgi:TrmH family RNA methyltransferase
MRIRDRVDIILVEPVEGGNVGSAARALKNMGFSRLRLVNPQYAHERDARKMAVHAADLVESACVHATLEEAIQSASWVVGLSCRSRSHPERKLPIGPEEMLSRLAGLPDSSKTALVFGPEPTGLSNTHLGRCQDILSLPTSDAYPSMNLAHAVLVTAWEIRRIDRQPREEHPAREMVTAGDLDATMEHMRRTLDIIGFLDLQNPELILNDLRKVLQRATLDPRELRMLRGIFHRMDLWIANHGGPPTPNQPRGGAKW